MKSTIQVMAGAVVLSSLSGTPAQADDHMNAQPVELYACTFREGKSMKDVEKANANFRKWSADNSSGQTVWMLSPQFRAEESDFHLGWIGAYQSAGDFGKTTDKWVNASGSVSQAYYDAVDCGHALVASYTIAAPDGPPDDGVVWFARCSLAEDASMEDAAASHASVSSMMGKMGAAGSSWMFVPGLGTGDAEFDYYHVAAWPSYPAFATAWEAYVNGGGMAKSEALFDGVTQCQSPNVYDASLVVATPDNS